MAARPSAPTLATAALLRREDGKVLLVREPGDAGRWTLPTEPVAPHEVAEQALLRILRERLHVEPGPFEFTDTLALDGGDERAVVNVFACSGWQGTPRYSGDRYADAAWAAPSAPGVPVVDAVGEWLRATFGGGDGEGPGRPATAAVLEATLTDAREALLAAFEEIPALHQEQPLLDGWSPVDVIAHCVAVEGYYAAESRRLVEIPGHTWRQFNEQQWEVEYRTRPTEDAATARRRLELMRDETLAWLRTLTTEDLARWGNHPERGAVVVAERIGKIAEHDHEHAGHLRDMARAAEVAAR